MSAQGALGHRFRALRHPDYTPEHNAIIEASWRQITQQLLPMLEGVPDLTLALLNAALTPLGQGARRDPKSVPEALLRVAMNTTTVSSLSPVSSSASSSLPNSASVAWAR